jgi:hypothetical protein
MHHLVAMFVFRARFLLLLLLTAFTFPLGLYALQQGQSMEEVSAEMGDPNGKRTFAEREIWVYSGDITLEFSDGKLVRAKGTMMEPAAEITRTIPEVSVPEEVSVPNTQGPAEIETTGEVAVADADNLDNEIRQFSEGMPELPAELDGFMGGEAEELPPSQSFLRGLILWLVPVILGFIFLLIAFKIVGVEAAKSALLFIAVADQAVMHSVQWFFLELLGFPSAMHADALASFVVMLVLVNKMTFAKQLPVAIKVVIMSKVAGLVAWYFLLLFLLHSL